MRAFTFYIHEAAQPQPAFDFVHCDDEAEALERARTLLSEYPHYEAIEIFDGAHDRVTVRRSEDHEVEALA